jgi:hypothetical protein
MTTIDRRAMLRYLLGGAAVATTGFALVPDQANSAPLTLSRGDAVAVETPVDQAAFISRRAGRRPRRRPRTKCWYHHGKRVCTTGYHR